MKTIALYLPQFHCIPENDKWWGKGFTEWTNLKKTVPRFEGHYQPRVPYKHNYYNLLEPGVLEGQAGLAKQCHIDAFCFYQYWFNGKMLLQKPLEMFRDNKNIDLEYCISWANESWTNHWNSGNTQIIMEQNYGDESSWRNHFDYLLPFFKDERYIKVDNKPLFLIYRPFLIEDLDDMLNLWDQLSKENGFDGMYIGYQDAGCFYENFSKKHFSFGVEYEPWFTLTRDNMLIHKYKIFRLDLYIQRWIRTRKSMKKNEPSRYSYDRVWKKILNRKEQKNIMKGIFPDWDNSPRHLTNNTGHTMEGSTPKKFQKYCTEMFRKFSCPFVFINAWNEWAEGAYMEPDGKYGYAYLEAFSKAYEDAFL